MDGWIKLHRCLLEKAIWQLNDAQRIVFITVLLLANHTGKQWLWKGTQFNAEPGQLVTSLPKLAKTARVSVQSVRTALDNLRKLDFLTYESTDTGRLITVTNWAFYQRKEKESTDQLTDDQQPINSLSTSTKNGKNVKNDKEDTYDYFADFWKEYPRKVAKADAVKAFAKLKMNDELMEVLMAGLYRATASESWLKDGGKFIPYPASWLNGRRWEDEVTAGGSNERVLRSKHEQGSSTGHSSDGNSASKIPEGFWG